VTGSPVLRCKCNKAALLEANFEPRTPSFKTRAVHIGTHNLRLAQPASVRVTERSREELLNPGTQRTEGSGRSLISNA
jgi:hypothetical protein